MQATFSTDGFPSTQQQAQNGLPAGGVMGQVLVKVSNADYDAGWANEQGGGTQGPPGPGVPTGGAAGQMLVKNTGSDFDTKWVDQPAGGGGSLVLGTVKSATGAGVLFTAIPASAKMVLINFAGVSTNGTSMLLLQLGPAAGLETAGYLGACQLVASGFSSIVSPANGFLIDSGTNAAAVRHGIVQLALLDPATNTWAMSGSLSRTDAAVTCLASGNKTLAAALSQLKITTVNGTDTFDAGKINISFL